ncbi:hypothetical protein ABOM_003595 [Aspergillus bombycis]|uniref:Uncharacterized protein n=1 Tax=Aspergillus bombycis TaxID=109264 RepID=A0A1F8ACI4_9EURO|nr:hypothetical protein ABOM_003595 [Aspergillus bombycis]OGM49377.1 hypothetical protein ABOM_003595 [Aspergillus bombycis]
MGQEATGKVSKLLPDVDLAWYHHLRDHLRPSDWIHSLPHEATPDIIASMKAFADALQSILCNDTVALDECLAYLSIDTIGATVRPDVLAIDWVSPHKSRIKLYAGTPVTTFRSALSTITLGGRIPVAQYSIDDL